MSWPTAIAMLCRFYGFSLAEVMAMTIRQFMGMLEQAGEVLKMECGDNKNEQETSLTGEQGFALAQRIFPRGKR